MIAVLAVRVVEMAVDDVVHVPGVGNRLVPAARAVRVRRRVCFAIMRRARRRILGRVELVLVDVIPMHEMKVPIVQIVFVVPVANATVTAAVTVNVIVVLVCLVVHRRPAFSWLMKNVPSRARALRE